MYTNFTSKQFTKIEIRKNDKIAGASRKLSGKFDLSNKKIGKKFFFRTRDLNSIF